MVTEYNVLCQGEKSEFLLPFIVYRIGDVKVYINNIIQSHNYSLSQLGNEDGAKISFIEILGSENEPIELKIIRKSQISPWLRFNDYENLKANMLNSAHSHIYTIMEDNRYLGELAGESVQVMENIQELLFETQNLQNQAIQAQNDAKNSANEALNAAKNAEETAQDVSDIANLNARAVGIDNTQLSSSVTNVQDSLNWLAGPSVMMPVGSVLIWFLNTPPQGYMQAKGQLLNRADYPELWMLVKGSEEALDENHWSRAKGGFSLGDGENTFRLPDLRDMFLRSSSNNRAIGSYQVDMFKSHDHNFKSDAGDVSNRFIAFMDSPSATKRKPSLVASNDRKWTYIDLLPAGGEETRPKNIALNFCIKVKSHI